MSDKYPDLNNWGVPACTLFALKIKEFLKRNFDDYPLIHFFGEDDNYDIELDDFVGDKNSFLNTYKYYFSHTVINIDGELYDSNGFTTSKEIIEKFQLINPMVVEDTSGEIAHKIYEMEWYEGDSELVEEIDNIIGKYTNYMSI